MGFCFKITYLEFLQVKGDIKFIYVALCKYGTYKIIINRLAKQTIDLIIKQYFIHVCLQSRMCPVSVTLWSVCMNRAFKAAAPSR